jgi:hypothetical protein
MLSLHPHAKLPERFLPNLSELRWPQNIPDHYASLLLLPSLKRVHINSITPFIIKSLMDIAPKLKGLHIDASIFHEQENSWLGVGDLLSVNHMNIGLTSHLLHQLEIVRYACIFIEHRLDGVDHLQCWELCLTQLYTQRL